MFSELASITESEIANRLSVSNKSWKKARFRPSSSAYEKVREIIPAAVLIPMFMQNDEWQVLFTRRNHSLAEHSGQVSFPGGRCEAGDTEPEETALREAYEEIGMDPKDVQILGKLHEFLTITNFLVTPVVGVIPWPYPLQISSNEVSKVFTIPLVWLADPNNYEVRIHNSPEIKESFQVVIYNSYEGENLWGASARFMLTLIEILLN